MSLQRWMGMATVLAAMAVPSVASASGVREGAQADPAGDATPAVSSYGGDPTRLVDVRAVRVAYDSGAGSLQVEFDGDLNGVGHSTLWLHAELSATSSGGCAAGAGALVVEGWESGRGYSSAVPTARLLDASGELVATGIYRDADQTGTGPRMSFVAPALAGRDLACVGAISATKAAGGYDSASRDDVDPFCLGSCAVAPAPAPAPADPPATPAPVGGTPAGPVVPAPPAPVTGGDQSTSPPAAALTLSGARAAAADALKARPGKSFERRAPGTYRLRCALSGATGTCTVSWRTRGTRYAGSLGLTARRVGATTSIEVSELAVLRV